MSFCKKLLALACVVSLLCSCLLPVCAEENPEDTTEAYTETTDSTEEPETTEETTEPTEPTETTEATEPEATEAEDSDSPQSSSSPAKVKTVNGFPLYNQLDYPNKRFGSGTVATSGCGITSLAMVATYLTGHTYLPDELAGYFGGYGENNVQRKEYGAKQMRLPIHKADNIRQIFSAMKEGNIAILLMNHLSIFTETQHFIVLNGVTKSFPPFFFHFPATSPPIISAGITMLSCTTARDGMAPSQSTEKRKRTSPSEKSISKQPKISV